MNSEHKWDKIIDSKSSFISFNLLEIIKYRDLIYLLVKRDFVTYYKQTILGPLWYIIQPLVNTIVFTIIFGKVAKISTDEIPPFLFYMCGTVAWTYFATCLSQTSNTFVSNKDLFGKVYFPRIVVPISVVLISLLQFFIQLSIFISFLIYYKINGSSVNPNINIIYIPLILIQLGILSLGFGILISSLTTKYKDLTFVMTFFIQIWMFATPVVYPLSIIPENYKLLAYLNPMTSVIEIFRGCFLGASSIDFNGIIISLIITLLVFFVGLLYFNKVEKSFMDTV